MRFYFAVLYIFGILVGVSYLYSLPFLVRAALCIPAIYSAYVLRVRYLKHEDLSYPAQRKIKRIQDASLSTWLLPPLIPVISLLMENGLIIYNSWNTVSYLDAAAYGALLVFAVLLSPIRPNVDK
ncbi:MAG: hypothetical protein MnENMB40S_21730 [Rhizobiaceae bacterium MnEN-MB40S]|nr:MAG: hypothetical protein MnENMB40S_21730 [Rhizobiaceae bacterium MnEN-MB40S]